MRPTLHTHCRLASIYCIAAALSLPIALLNLSKLIALLSTIALMVVSPADKGSLAWHRLMPFRLIVAAFLLFWVSASWSAGTSNEIFKSVSQHGNLLVIPVLYYLIRTRREAAIALGIYLIGQFLLTMSTYALYFQIPVPWKMTDTGQPYAVFSSYLDQPIMTAVFAAITWHLRELLPEKRRDYSAIAIICMALGVIFFIFIGRTGHLVALSLITLVVFWEMPRRFRPAIVIVPVLVSLVALSFSSKVNERFKVAVIEIQAALERGDVSKDQTSTGLRMNYWLNSIRSIETSPWIGHGAGSWNSQYNAIQKRLTGNEFVETSANAHQEYLFWGVELGLLGIALLLAILVSFYLMSTTLPGPSRRATQSVLAAIATACLFNCALYDAYIGDYLCITLALVICYGMKPMHENARPLSATSPGI